MKQVLRLGIGWGFDSVIAAIVMGVWIAKLSGGQVPFLFWVALGISVWGIYALDRVRDAMVSHGTLTSERHALYLKHKTKVLILIGIAGILSIAKLIYLGDFKLIIGATLLFLAVLGHLWGLQFKRYGGLKEWVTSVIFTAGASLGPWAFSPDFNAAITIPIALIVFQNVVTYAFWDYDSDQQDNRTSIAVLFPKPRLQRYLGTLWILAILVIGYWWRSGVYSTASLSGLLILTTCQRWGLNGNTRSPYSKWGMELAFGIPLLFTFL